MTLQTIVELLQATEARFVEFALDDATKSLHIMLVKPDGEMRDLQVSLFEIGYAGDRPHLTAETMRQLREGA